MGVAGCHIEPSPPRKSQNRLREDAPTRLPSCLGLSRASASGAADPRHKTDMTEERGGVRVKLKPPARKRGRLHHRVAPASSADDQSWPCRRSITWSSRSAQAFIGSSSAHLRSIRVFPSSIRKWAALDGGGGGGR